MSLLNQMLRDLDRRDAPAVERAGLAAHVRTLPARARPSRRRDAMLLLAGVVAGGVVTWAVSRYPGDIHQGAAAPAPAPAPTPAPAPEPAVSMMPPAALSSPPASPASVPAPPSARSLPSLRMTPDLGARPPPGMKPALPPQAAAPQKAPPPPEARTPETPPQIDKTSRTPKVSEVADAEYRKALSAVRRGSLAEGVDGLRHALQLDSRHAQARQALLSVLVDQKQWREAQTVAVDGLALDPTQSSWAMIAARLLVEQGEVARAAELLAAHGAPAERNADYQAFRGLLLHKLQRYGESAQRYQAALSLRPAEGRWWYGLGLSLDADHRDAEAQDAYRKARDSGTLPPDLAAQVAQKLR